MAVVNDILIVGGGVIGLSLAYELATRGLKVRVLDQGQPGMESSWAGAGILPPARFRPGDPPLVQLAGISHKLHGEWAERLREETGCDTGYRRCGGLHIALDRATDSALREAAELWRTQGIEAHALSPQAALDLEPALAPLVCDAFLLPDECQLRNPRHLRALLQACCRRGVVIEPQTTVHRVATAGGRIAHVVTPCGNRSAGAYCLCVGAWTGALAAELGCRVAVRPVRGQIVLLDAGQHVHLTRVINIGARYLVPRNDGLVLVGSTQEHVGFEKRTTAAGVHELLALAVQVAPGLRAAHMRQCWAGLRPGSADGLPYLGRLPGLDNAFIAAGHFRSGLHLSTGTAVLMADLVCGQRPAIDMSPFRPDRA